ncbi:MAG: ATP-binding protein [Coriobacteriia bacterium]|nr:ATP-binding protein [Coriobacteriia bacterium]
MLRTVIAFASSVGGELVIGVADGQTLAGIADPLMEEGCLANLITGSIRPQLALVFDLITRNGKTLLVARVAAGSQRPYHLKSTGRHEGTYYQTQPDGGRHLRGL